jgi:hypothetical protein
VGDERMNLRRFDLNIEYYDRDDDEPFLQEEEREGGAYASAYEALDIITVQKERIAELESALCETCKDPACEDSVVELLKQKVARLEKALGRIKAHTNITWIKDVCKAALEG